MCESLMKKHNEEPLMSDTQRLINAYRKTLQPGIYFFSAKIDGSKIVSIETTVKKYVTQDDHDRHGVIFVYYPACMPMNDVEKLTPYIEETPQHFQIKLIEYLKEKLGRK
jgi:hypothetical protein